MSSAFYPQGMNSYNRTPQGRYKSWKGSDNYQNPIGNIPTHIRPLTNKDPGNIFPTKIGLPRPIKHYRKGRNMSNVSTNDVNSSNYNLNRVVKSSNGQGLGGGLISDCIDKPGGVNINTNVNNTNCVGVNIVSDWYPIINVTEKIQPKPNIPNLYNNQETKALRRTRSCSTILKKNYYQTSDMYLYNRCQTFNQRQFNFVVNTETDPTNPDLTQQNLYVAQCCPNLLEPTTYEICGEKYEMPTDTRNCGRVYYKPNNPGFAKQGAVSSSTRLLKLNVDTMNTNQALNKRYNSDAITEANNNIPFVYKIKTQRCNPSTYKSNPFFSKGQPPCKTITTLCN